MTPFFFGFNERRLFGIYMPAHGSGSSPSAVVVCYPWGQEYLRSHRSLKYLSTLLARSGVDVLRFDYYGTGDSAGDMSDGTLAGWEADIETAIEELKDTTSASRVGLVGLRLGATLAARVAARRNDIDRLALWDPVVLGDEYLHDLERTDAEVRFHGAWTPDGVGATGERTILGFALSEALTRDIAALNLADSLPALPSRTLILASQPLSSHDSLRRQHAVEDHPGPPVWLEDADSGVGAMPVHLIQHVAGWLR